MSLDNLKEQILSAGAVTDQYFLDNEHNVHAVTLDHSVRMKIVMKNGFRTIREAVERDLDLGVGVAIDGSFGGFEPAWQTTGYVVQRGQLVDGSSFMDSAYMVFAGGRYGFGKGNTPGTYQGALVAYGLGGLVPVILDGKRCVNRWYNENNEITGRCLVGYRPSAQHIAVVVQGDDDRRYDLDRLQNFMMDIGCTSAVGLDGSTSAMLRYHGVWIVNNSRYKNHVNPNAVAFYFGH